MAPPSIANCAKPFWIMSMDKSREFTNTFARLVPSASKPNDWTRMLASAWDSVFCRKTRALWASRHSATQPHFRSKHFRTACAIGIEAKRLDANVGFRLGQRLLQKNARPLGKQAFGDAAALHAFRSEEHTS